MVETEVCDQIESAIKSLLNEGNTVVEARDIAEKTEIESGDLPSPGHRVAVIRNYGHCPDFDEVGWEIISMEKGSNPSNEYRLRRK
jgi:hypothetical protein